MSWGRPDVARTRGVGAIGCTRQKDLRNARTRERVRSLVQEGRSVGGQTPLQNRLREGRGAWRPSIEKLRSETSGTRGDYKSHDDIVGQASQSGGIRRKSFRRSDRDDMQRLTTGDSRALGRRRVCRNGGCTTVVRGGLLGWMAFDHRQAEGAMVRKSQPRNRSERDRCPTKERYPASAQHAALCPKKPFASILCFQPRPPLSP